MNDNTITVFNYHSKSKTWKKTVINGVSVVFGVDKSVNGSGTVIINQIMNIVIPKEANTQGKRYIDSIQYGKLDNPEEFWTLDPISNKEYIVSGECEKEIDDSYKVTSLKSDYAKCGITSGVNDYTDLPRLRHFKVVVKIG